MKKLVLALGFPALWLAAPAYAHFNLTAPSPNTTTTDGGMGSPPCGVGTASGMITPAQGGHPITIKIDEFVGHTGFYRVSLALNSPSELPLDPVVKNSAGAILPPSGKPAGTSATAVFSDSPVFPVLGDHLLQHNAANTDQKFQVDITLPNVNCDKCTLQVLEFMEGHGFNGPTPPDTGPGGGYFYRHCADLKITADATLPLMGSAGAGGAAATGGSTSAGGSGGAPSSGGVGVGVGVGGGVGVGVGGGVVASGGGGSPSSAGANAGGATAGSDVTGAAGTAATSADNGGCSCALGKRSTGAASLGLLVGLLAFGGRRRRARQLRG